MTDTVSPGFKADAAALAGDDDADEGFLLLLLLPIKLSKNPASHGRVSSISHDDTRRNTIVLESKASIILPKNMVSSIKAEKEGRT